MIIIIIVVIIRNARRCTRTLLDCFVGGGDDGGGSGGSISRMRVGQAVTSGVLGEWKWVVRAHDDRGIKNITHGKDTPTVFESMLPAATFKPHDYSKRGHILERLVGHCAAGRTLL